MARATTALIVTSMLGVCGGRISFPASKTYSAHDVLYCWMPYPTLRVQVLTVLGFIWMPYQVPIDVELYALFLEAESAGGDEEPAERYVDEGEAEKDAELEAGEAPGRDADLVLLGEPFRL
ncbi:hypothetical protein COL516b_012406 [Colletotrichum fioriniae]|nr:uncharacterized protein COL516b_012406 [Colletotrichum fioriniae]KAJ0295593.1 hypothetical protein COL516b_012406 [Colletotrichum fioriniae]